MLRRKIILVLLILLNLYYGANQNELHDKLTRTHGAQIAAENEVSQQIVNQGEDDFEISAKERLLYLLLNASLNNQDAIA